MPVPVKTSYQQMQDDLDAIVTKKQNLSIAINQIDANDAVVLAQIDKLKSTAPIDTNALAAKEQQHLNNINQKRDQTALLNNLNKQEQQLRDNINSSQSDQAQSQNAGNSTNPTDPAGTTTSTDSIINYNPLTNSTSSTPIDLSGISPLQSTVNQTTGTTPVEDEVSKLRTQLKNQGNLSCNNADIGGFKEDPGAVKTSGEITVVNQNDHSLFAGLKMDSTQYQAADGTKINVDSYTAQRIKYYESKDKTKGFIIPWDARLGMAYTSTQSIGNYMPYGEEWVGSPSLMNPYALIRFEHIASRNHHHYIIDQRGVNGGFRGTKFKPYANIKDFSAGQVGTNSNGQTQVNLSPQDKLNLGVYPGDAGNASQNVLADDSGALYVDEVDYTQQIWKPTKAVIQSTGNQKSVYEITDSPSSIIVNRPNSGNAGEVDKLNALKTSSIGATLSSSKSSTDNTLTPDQPAFWLVRQGWEQCSAGGQTIYVTSGNCVNGKVASASKEEIAQIQKNSDQLKSFIDTQIGRNWQPQSYATNRKYLRKPNTQTQIREPLEPTCDNLCNSENWVGEEQFQYTWNNFLYCSYYGWIPNNYLITLRRYPVPCNDAATVPDQDKTKQHLLPVAQAVTYFGDVTGNSINDIMSFSARMNWREIEAQVNEIQGNEQGNESSPFGAGFSKWLGILSGQSDFSRVSGWDEQRAKFDPYNDGMYANRIFGPVNVITSTKARARGLTFEHSINLNFHYTLRSLGGVNPKAAMLDIMSNILALTYNNANFWGGANRYFPNKPAYPFLGGKKGMQSWYSGNVTGFMDGIADQLVSVMGNLGSMFQSLLTNPKDALKSIAGKGAQVWMADKQREKRPAILGFKALLTGDPVGEWHLTLGNPFNPMMTIGNLICTGVKFAFSDQLLTDDFSEEMTVTIQLEHGRPRDKGDIESMFNRGGGRLHYSYFGSDTEIWNTASSTSNSKVDTSWKSNKTTIVDNFSGKTSTVTGYTPGSNTHTSAGADIGVSQAFPPSSVMAFIGKSFGTGISATTKLAFDLAAKVGFKSGN